MGDGQIVPDLLLAGRELSRAKTIIASLLGLSRQTRTYSEKVDMDAVVVDTMAGILDRFPEIDKVGLGLRVDDLPASYPLAAAVSSVGTCCS